MFGIGISLQLLLSLAKLIEFKLYLSSLCLYP